MDSNLFDVTIFHFDKIINLKKKFLAKKANIKNNDWKLKNVTILN